VTGELSDQMRQTWGHVFNLGGIGGIPFVGKTGFTAFSHHVPDDGNLFVVYAPNIGISPNGEVGKLLRDGQHKLTMTCSSAIKAYNSVLKGEQVPDGATHNMMIHLKFTIAKNDTPEVDLMPELLQQFKIHEHGGKSEPELTKREGAFWARQRS